MCRRIASLALAGFLSGLLPTAAYAQLDGLYEFDGGGDGTSWDDADNWEQVLDPLGNPISGNPATPPDAVTTAEIPLLGVAIDNTMPGQTALDVDVGTVDGAGSLAVSGGDLQVGRDLAVGSDDVNGLNPGVLLVSGGVLDAGDDITVGAGSTGIMVMTDGAVSTGDDFFVNASSSVDMTGGMITVGDRLVLDDDGSLTLNNGDIIVNDDFFFFGDSNVTVNGGVLEAADKLRFDDDVSRNGKLTINGGIVRSNEFGIEESGLPVFRGVVEINGDGVYQVEAPGVGDPLTQLSVAAALLLIADGVHFTTLAGALTASTVIVPDFFGELDVPFTQISVVPEPASVVLLAVAALGLAMRQRRVW